MSRNRTIFALAALAGAFLALRACHTTGEPAEARVPDHPSLAFAQEACGGCHAVRVPGLSPNPASPTFADIANRDGITQATLTAYLTDAHNYPEVMDFELDAARTEGLVDYILSLRSEGYRPRG